MSRYLVTGGCGFIGSHLVDALLAAGHHVRVVDDLSTGTMAYLQQSVEFMHGCVTDPALAERAVAGIDGCFHLAAIASVQRSAEDLLGTHRVNSAGMVTVLQALRSSGQRAPLVYASSAAIYGDCATVPISENEPARPRSAYGADKYGNELHASVATNSFAIPATGLRFFNVYGPRQMPDSPYSGVVSVFAKNLGLGLPITVFGDGGQTRDLVYVADVVTALTQAMARRLPNAPVFNVCTGRGTSVLELAQTMGRLLGRTPAILHGPARTGEVRHSVGNPSAGRSALGLADPVPLEAGLRSLLGR